MNYLDQQEKNSKSSSQSARSLEAAVNAYFFDALRSQEVDRFLVYEAVIFLMISGVYLLLALPLIANCAVKVEVLDSIDYELLAKYEAAQQLSQNRIEQGRRRLGKYLGGGVEKVPQFWWTFVEPAEEDDVRECNLDLWDNGQGGGWKHTGNYSRLQTYFTICRNGLEQLHKDRAGRNGPVPYATIWNFMCGVECPLSDQYHLEAMDYTGCSCDQLSTQPHSEFYSVEGDFCIENGSRQLCSILGECGEWDCPLGDFMCPSHEFRRKHFVGYGSGDCSSAVSSAHLSLVLFSTVLLSLARFLLVPAVDS